MTSNTRTLGHTCKHPFEDESMWYYEDVADVLPVEAVSDVDLDVFDVVDVDIDVAFSFSFEFPSFEADDVVVSFWLLPVCCLLSVWSLFFFECAVFWLSVCCLLFFWSLFFEELSFWFCCSLLVWSFFECAFFWLSVCCLLLVCSFFEGFLFVWSFFCCGLWVFPLTSLLTCLNGTFGGAGIGETADFDSFTRLPLYFLCFLERTG